LFVCVDEELSIDGVADLMLEGPDRFPLGLALVYLSLEVDPTLGALLADLADGHHVDGVVELPVASSAETVDDPASRGVFDGGCTCIGGELIPVGEPTDVTGVADQSAS
jgi:hypothetical protein